MRRIRSFLLSLLALCGSLLVCLGLAEVLFRTVLSEDKFKPKEWSDRPEFYYISENSPTFQDRPRSKTKPENTFRVAVVGDSFAFAPYMQFDDTFSQKLERMLNLNNTALKAEVLNYGVPRYSTSHEIQLAERAIEEGADLIVLQICLNDPEIKPYRPTSLIGGTVDRFGGIEYKEGLLSKWKTGAFVAKRLYNSSSRQKYVSYFEDLWTGEKTKKNFVDSFERIVTLARERNIKIVGLVFPLVGLPIDESYPFTKIHQQISEICKNSEISCLDLLEAYRGIPIDRMQVIVRKDFHPNEIGHRIAGERLYSFLEASRLIPEPLQIKKKFKERIGIKLEEAQPAN